MSVNTAHANGGVLIHSGEYILLYCKNTSIQFAGSETPLFQDCIPGHIYLTSNRIIFRSRRQTEILLSLSAPFTLLSDIELQQPAYIACHIRGKLHAQPNGNFIGEIKFRLTFKAGGAIEFFQALMCAASMALSDSKHEPPKYTPSRAWYEAPKNAYQLPGGFYDWLPTHDAFTQPRPNSVFMTDNPPPYPGIGRPFIQRESFALTSRSGRCLTPNNSFEGYEELPFYGRYRFSPKDSVFPHHPCVLPQQMRICRIDEISDMISQYSGLSENFITECHEGELSTLVEDVATARTWEQRRLHYEEGNDFQKPSITVVESSDESARDLPKVPVEEYSIEIADVQLDQPSSPT